MTQDMLRRVASDSDEAYRKLLKHALDHPEANITVDADRQPHLTETLKTAIEQTKLCLTACANEIRFNLNLYQQAVSGKFHKFPGTFVLVHLNEDAGRDYDSVLRLVTDAYSESWGFCGRIDKETTRFYYDTNPGSVFFKSGSRMLRQIVSTMDEIIHGACIDLMRAASVRPKHGVEELELMRQLQLYLGCLNECPEPFSPYLTLTVSNDGDPIFGTQIGGNVDYILEHLDDYAGIVVSPTA